MSIRKAAPGEETALFALHAAATVDGWNAQSFASFVQSPGTFVLVHDDDGLIVVRMAAGEAEILTVGVLPAARRKGIGGALVRAAAGHAAARNCKDLFLEVGIENQAARALYTSLGFRQVGYRKAYYPKPGAPPEDALVMKADPSRLGVPVAFD